MSKGVWVLTESYNDYDQHGECFSAIWEKKPSLEQLAEYFGMNAANVSYSNPMEALAFLLHVEKGGGKNGKL